MGEFTDIYRRAADAVEARRQPGKAGYWLHTDVPDAPLCIEGGMQAALGIPRDFSPGKVGDALMTLYKHPAYIHLSEYLGCDSTLDGIAPNVPLYLWMSRQGDPDEQTDAVIQVLREIP